MPTYYFDDVRLVFHVRRWISRVGHSRSFHGSMMKISLITLTSISTISISYYNQTVKWVKLKHVKWVGSLTVFGNASNFRDEAAVAFNPDARQRPWRVVCLVQMSNISLPLSYLVTHHPPTRPRSWVGWFVTNWLIFRHWTASQYRPVWKTRINNVSIWDQMNNEIDTQSRDSVGQWAVHDVRMVRDPSNSQPSNKKCLLLCNRKLFQLCVNDA